MGNLTLENVPFYVMDFTTGNAEADKYIGHLDVIIGITFIEKLEEVQINFAENKLISPKVKSSSKTNLFYDGSRGLNLKATHKGQTLLLNPDTGGASYGNLNELYFNKNRAEIEGKFEQDTIRAAGAGGVVTYDTYVIPNFDLSVGESTYTIPKIHVALNGDLVKDGILGIDYFAKFRKVTINTKDMFMAFEDKE